MAAIRALEARSLEFMHEKEEKKRLEQRIAMLMGQMIRGERNPGDNTNGVIIMILHLEQSHALNRYRRRHADLCYCRGQN